MIGDQPDRYLALPGLATAPLGRLSFENVSKPVRISRDTLFVARQQGVNNRGNVQILQPGAAPQVMRQSPPGG